MNAVNGAGKIISQVACMSNPRLFIGSSRESLPLAEVLADGLRSCAEVDLWNEVFDPQQTYLGTLLRIPETYDFGVFVLGPDDSVVSRGKAQAAPRDNVIFELGLFMQALGVDRTFPVMPKEVKVCSDFLGWKHFDYEEPAIWQEFRAKIERADTSDERQALRDHYRTKLEPAVKAAIIKITEKIKQVGPKPDVSIHAVAEGVHDIWPSIRELVGQAVAMRRPVTVRHLGLDLADAWDLLRDGILRKENIKDLTWRCLMIDPDSLEIIRADSPSVSRDAARQAITKIEQTLSLPRFKENLEARKLVFQCRAYSDLPRMHGFGVENHALLLSMCDIDQEGKLDATSTPYFRFNAGETTHSQHVVACFQNWFEYRWNQGSRHVWPAQA